MIADNSTDAFVIGSLLRQLLEVWRLDPEKELGTKLVPLLRSALVKKKGGGVTLTAEDLSAGRLNSLEKVFGADRYQPLQWWRNGLARCRAVARIDDGSGYAHGTGFLLKGSDLHDTLPELVVVTNGHVVPDSVTKDNAVVTFHGLDNDAAVSRFKVRDQWWYSPPGHRTVDTAVLELDGAPADVEPLPVAKTWPNLDSSPGRTSSAIQEATSSRSSRSRTTCCSISTTPDCTTGHRRSQGVRAARCSTINGR